MRVKIVGTTVVTNSAGVPVDSIPAREAVANETDSAGNPVAPVVAEIVVDGAPVRIVVGKTAVNSAGLLVGTTSMSGLGPVAPVAPIAVNDTIAGLQTTPKTIPIATLTANDTLNGASLVSVLALTNCTVSIVGSDVVVTASPATFDGFATFRYTLTGPGGSATADVSLEFDYVAPSFPRYWQIQISANNGHTQTFVQRLELYDASLDYNMSYGVTLTGDGSAGSFPPSALNNSANPIPIVGNDYWKDEISTPVTLEAVFDFGAGGADIKGFGLMVPGLSADWRVASPKDFKLRSSSDNATWTDVVTVANATAWATYGNEMRQYYAAGVVTANVSRGVHRYWRFLFNAAYYPNHCVVANVTMRTALGGANVATGGTASAYSVYQAGFEADKAFDGNSATAWHSFAGGPGGHLTYDFGAGNEKDIIQVSVESRNEPSFANVQTPYSGLIQFSDNGTVWHTAFPFGFGAGENLFAAAETRVYTDPRKL